MNLGSRTEDLEANLQTEPHHIIEVPDNPSDLPGSLKDLEDTTATCSICYLDLPVTSIIHPLACEHSFCRDCYTEYLENKMKSFEVLKITCPQDGCPEIVTDERIKTILSEDRFQRYQELVQKKLSHKSWGQKYCPKAGCYKEFVPDPNNKSTVCTCGIEICNVCSQEWHPGKPCIEIKDEEFAEYAKANNIKFCIVCKTAIDRVEGCLHVTCSVCDYEWCWSCGQQYNPKHVCKGVWDPSVPLMNANETKPRGKIVSCLFTFLKILIAPFAILGVILFVLLFWPLIIQKDNARYRNQPRNRKVKIAICSLLVGIVCLPIVLICLACYILIILLAGIFLCFSDPGYQKIFARRRRIRRLQRERRRIRQNPRWKMKDGNNFQYTGSSKPQNQNGADQQDVVNENVNIVEMRGPRIDAERIQPIDPPNFIPQRHHSLDNLRRRGGAHAAGSLEQIQIERRPHNSVVLDRAVVAVGNPFDLRKIDIQEHIGDIGDEALSLPHIEKSIGDCEATPYHSDSRKQLSLPFDSEEEDEKSIENFEEAREDKKDDELFGDDNGNIGSQNSIKIRDKTPTLIKINSIDSRKLDMENVEQIEIKEALEIKIVE